MSKKPVAPETSPVPEPQLKRPSARERVFKTAADLFYRKGIRAVGVETIAAEADTTKMSLYRSFPSKDELVAEWLRDHDTNFWKTWDEMTRHYPDDPRKQIGAAFFFGKKQSKFVFKLFALRNIAGGACNGFDVFAR